MVAKFAAKVQIRKISAAFFRAEDFIVMDLHSGQFQTWNSACA